MFTDNPDNKDEIFYTEWQSFLDDWKLLTKIYDKTRNFASKKGYSTDQIKINFDNGTLLNGWDCNKESDNMGVLLEKNGEFFLGITIDNKIFDYQWDIDNYQAPESKASIKKSNLKKQITANSEEKSWNKMVYKLLPGPNKMLPKVFFSDKRLGYFNPSDAICLINEKGSHKKGDKFSVQDCHKLIDFFKASINKHPEWKLFNFCFSNTDQYDDISAFYREVQNQGYSLNFDRIKSDYITQIVNEKKLFLFKIYNKDFSKFSKGKPNLHTLYWKAIFNPENLAEVVVKLNGEAEFFFRDASKSASVTHIKNTPINNKNDLNPKKESTFEYDLIKDKRFTQQKFFFHVPITLNFKQGVPIRFNNEVLTKLKTTPLDNLHIIGIDRGERHLLYYSVINAKTGEIIEQDSFNTIKNTYIPERIDEDGVITQGEKVEKATDYHHLLNVKEGDRATARKDWIKIENIKELKAGYLSHVVHKIATLMEKHNAIVVLEDLNFGFKRGRFKVEKQVYQKFEKALIDKLNYLVFKNKEDSVPGGVLNAYQLTAPFTSFKDIGKQTGFLFYVPAHHTSKICPWTGFVDWLKPAYKSVDESKSFFANFDSIHFNKDKNYFEFVLDYEKFRKFANIPEGLAKKTPWTLCTHGMRWIAVQNKEKLDKEKKWGYKEIDLTDELKTVLMPLANILEGENLIERIIERNDKDFFTSLTWVLRVLLQLRYGMKEYNSNGTIINEFDYILSPVANTEGKFFDSREFSEVKDAKYPKDADANGAYNIARKGQLLLKKNIANAKVDDKGQIKCDLKIDKVAWFNDVQANSIK